MAQPPGADLEVAGHPVLLRHSHGTARTAWEMGGGPALCPRPAGRTMTSQEKVQHGDYLLSTGGASTRSRTRARRRYVSRMQWHGAVNMTTRMTIARWIAPSREIHIPDLAPEESDDVEEAVIGNLMS